MVPRFPVIPVEVGPLLSDGDTMAALARAALYSQWHAARLFKEVTGKAPFEYVRLRRLSAAAQSLRETPSRVVDVAFDFVFDSHEGFTRAFARQFGMPPRTFRKEAATVELPGRTTTARASSSSRWAAAATSRAARYGRCERRNRWPELGGHPAVDRVRSRRSVVPASAECTEPSYRADRPASETPPSALSTCATPLMSSQTPINTSNTMPGV